VNINNKNGFTLVELVVVIVVLGVLMLLIGVGLRVATENTRTRVCDGNRRNLKTMIVYYQGKCSIMGIPEETGTQPVDYLANPENSIHESLLEEIPKCPSGGEKYIISFTPDVDVYCTIHNKEP